MRPLRPLVALVACATGWLWLRTPIIRADFARFVSVATPKKAEVYIRRAPATRPLVAAIEPTLPTLVQARHDNPLPAEKTSGHAVSSGMTAFPTPLVSTSTLSPQLIVISTPPAAVTLVPPTMSQADAAYEALRRHDRRSAAQGFRSALDETPSDPRAAAWRAELRVLEKRWSGSAYVLARGDGSTDLAASPLLGGGQSGARIAYALDPLAARPVSIEARASAPNASPGAGAQVALGMTWRATSHLELTAERISAPGRGARGGWAGRIAGGTASTRPEGAIKWLDASIYAEVGVIGLSHPATYGAVQGRVGKAIATGRDLTLAADLGFWASTQHDQGTVSRLDIGPSVALRCHGIEISADYRLRAAGNARPRSGPALTIAAYF